MERVDDRLAPGDQILVSWIQIGDPAKSLLRRRDVVAPGAEYHDRRLDVTKVDLEPVRRPDVPRGQPVADEKIVRDPLHLACVHEDRAAPPRLELEEPIR